jgi:LPS-assembly lipoprotein
MLSFNRSRPFAVAVLTAGLLLGACGFKPLYGSTANTPSAVEALAHVDIQPIADREGQMMRTALQRRLNGAAKGAAQYKLTVTLKENIAKLAIQRNAFATRANLRLAAQYRLTRLSDGQTLNDGGLRSVSSYNIMSSDFATYAAQNDARSRAIEDLADRIQTRLAAYFAGPFTESGAAAAPGGERLSVYP